MKISAVSKIISSIALFSALRDDDINFLIKNSELKTFSAGEKIELDDSIAIILRGSVTVTGQDGDKRLLIRILSQGSVSGVASLFCEDHTPLTVLTAQKATEALIVSHGTVSALIVQNPEFAMSYIRFLTSRIRFLNGRIKAYTVESTEAKLALHLLLAQESNGSRIELPVSLSTLADMLGMGRASLYRALDSLTERGIISRQGKIIWITDTEGLRDASHGRV